MKKVLLCRYDYDPLDRLTGLLPDAQAPRQRFYRQNRLATDIQGDVRHTILQHGDQLLALQSRDATSSASTLLATDPQHSVLYTLSATEQQAMAYSPYGHHPTVGANQQLLGFNGECADPVTGHYLLGNGYRAFNPVLMRFNSPDSWSPFSMSGVNTYTYCRNRPINSNDPSGHFTLFIGAQLIRWSRRAQARLVQTTGVIYLAPNRNSLSRYTLSPGVTPVAAVTARAKMFKVHELGNVVNFKINTHSERLTAAKSQYLSLKDTTGQYLSAYPNIQEILPKKIHHLATPRPESESYPFLKNIEIDRNGHLRHRSEPSNSHFLNYSNKLSSDAENLWNTYNIEYLNIKNAHFIRTFP